MKMMIALMLAFVSTLANAAWVAGYEQGTSTWYQDLPNGGYATWECREGHGALRINPTGQMVIENFTLSMDGLNVEFVGGVPKDYAFSGVWDRFRSGQNVSAIIGGVNSVTIPMDNASAVMPASNSADYSCPTVQQQTQQQPAPAAQDLQTNEVDLTTEHQEGGWWTKLTIRSMRDELKVTDVVVNRGRCPRWKEQWPAGTVVFKFGDTQDYYIKHTVDCREVLEVSVVTNHGTITFK